jgi:hypothetical protein
MLGMYDIKVKNRERRGTSMNKKGTQGPTMSITGENVIGTINADGHAQVKIDQKIIHQATPELENLFKSLHKKVKTRPQDPKLETGKLEEQVKKIEMETAKGEAADKTKLEGWIRKLAKMAPDIVDVMAASLGGPVAGFTAVFKKIVDRAKAVPAGQ